MVSIGVLIWGTKIRRDEGVSDQRGVVSVLQGKFSFSLVY